MDPGLVAKSLLLGFAVAAPVGPVGVLVIRRTLTLGPRAGLASGLGAATADAAYGSIAALGLGFLTRPLVAHAGVLQLAGGLFLCWFGARMLRGRRASHDAARDATGRGWRAYFSTLLLTITNPMTILSFAAAFAGLGLVGQAAGPVPGLALVSAVFAESTVWWVLLSGGVGLLRHALGPGALRAADWASGLVLLGCGLLALLGIRR